MLTYTSLRKWFNFIKQKSTTSPNQRKPSTFMFAESTSPCLFTLNHSIKLKFCIWLISTVNFFITKCIYSSWVLFDPAHCNTFSLNNLMRRKGWVFSCLTDSIWFEILTTPFQPFNIFFHVNFQSFCQSQSFSNFFFINFRNLNFTFEFQSTNLETNSVFNSAVCVEWKNSLRKTSGLCSFMQNLADHIESFRRFYDLGLKYNHIEQFGWIFCQIEVQTSSTSFNFWTILQTDVLNVFSDRWNL